MESRFKNISANNDLDYYANSCLNNGSESNKTFTFDTIQYFKKTLRNTIFQPLEFLNLFYEQISYFDKNTSKPYTTIKNFRELPITSEEKHILFGFILKWYGGYPFHVNSYIPHSVCLKLLENEFLSFESDTLEKQYCLKVSTQKVVPFNTSNKATKYQYSQKDFEGYTANNDWDFYYGGEGEVKNIELIFNTIEYFETGERKGFIEPLAALNLIYYHNKFIVENNKTPYSNIEVLQNLPLNSEIKHVLFGMIIFWFGGSTYNSDWSGGKFQDNLKLIEEEFLSYEGETPEKVLLGYIKTPESSPHLKLLIDALRQKPTITEKLNYWLEIKDNFKDIYPQTGLSFKKIFMPDYIYLKYFKEYMESTEYLKMVDNYEVIKYFNNSIIYKELHIKLNTDNKIGFIESELKKLDKFKKEVINLTITQIEQGIENVFKGLIYLKEQHKKLSNIESKFPQGTFEFEELKKIKAEIQIREEQIEYLKITELRYYDENQLSTDWNNTFYLKKNVAVNTYIKHVLYKDLLETKLKELEPPAAPESPKIEEVEEMQALETKIRDKTAFMITKDPRRHEDILSKSDYEKLILWLIEYFENHFVVPTIIEPIKKINTNKGNVVYTFISLFDDIHTGTRPKSLFELIQKCFYEYRNDKIDNIQKSTRKPQFYDSLIKKTK